MNLPKIDLASLPDLETLTALYGAMRHGHGHNDTIVALAAIVYESSPGGGGLI